MLAGEVGVTGLAAEWNAAGWPNSRGGQQWRHTSVRGVLTSARNAGLRQHDGQVVGQASWPPILDRITHERLLAYFGDPSKRRTGRRGPFTSLLRCGVCGAVLHHSAKTRGDVWACGACGRISVLAAPVEALVLDMVYDAVDQVLPAPPRLLPVGELEDVEARLVAVADDFAAGLVTRAQFIAATGGLTVRRDALTAAVSVPQRVPVARLREKWPHMDDGQRSAALAAVVDRVIVSKGRPGGVFDPGRVEVRWRA